MADMTGHVQSPCLASGGQEVTEGLGIKQTTCCTTCGRSVVRAAPGRQGRWAGGWQQGRLRGCVRPCPSNYLWAQSHRDQRGGRKPARPRRFYGRAEMSQNSEELLAARPGEGELGTGRVVRAWGLLPQFIQGHS